MSNRKIWEVDFDVVGPISIVNEINFRQEKGFDQHQFYSDIRLRKSPYGIRATITAYADSISSAETVAYVYFGRMRDVLSLENDIPILLYKYEGAFNNQRNFMSRRLLNKSDIIAAFKMARKFEIEQPKLLRSIGWYSKGKISQNTFDKFLAFWNVIEILGKQFHTETERTARGVKNQIYQCFMDYFGEIEGWGLPERWIDEMYDKRNEIVHGGEDTTIEAINTTSELIPLLEQTSKKIIDKIIDTYYEREEFIHLDF
ncbi:methylamine utilization protein MauJ [Priestia flexa]|uniref:HEPN domain-containing protein n=1 Tax=Priestia flexa TaxID=86664 RepID=A0ABU4JAY8_9BACI|nr:methylamine utilization protein MauJ [Priestia flexa]MDW8518169.1 HEPN domain-containing protein [Priestia flexa]